MNKNTLLIAEYEQQLRMSVERELLLLQEELNTKYKKKKTGITRIPAFR